MDQHSINLSKSKSVVAACLSLRPIFLVNFFQLPLLGVFFKFF
ncbi:hypothetical protein HMPREF0541_01665 [Lacticaseibacillus rhamnosus ATCC 21052]|nr:hypothetical protein HMPREF0541_01665 [Lacticaseibacillus rhamnosus ATCC 21052]